ncbi:hypothetical protein HHI36_007935 [Cryptolaemus montrouzieri]|uniref:Uncharacterized protein n=1 Tax=Cryptolaemus montrouzieri TaxID=559131 RepID=A0ABD2MR38_9CUCU
MKMAAKSRGRCSKRKAKDFIYEITENDLSADDDCEESPSKIYKISSDIQATSESSDQPNLRITETNSDQINKTSEGNSTNIVTSANKKVELSECPPEIVLVQEKEISVTDEMRIDEGSNVTHTCSTVKNAEKDSNCEMSIVEINDSDTDLSSSVQLIEKTIPLVELSDGETLDSVDATQAENTINESFVIIDEVGPTPIKEVDNPIITISFKNEDTKKCYESRILKFLQTFTEFEVFSNDLSVNCCKKLELCTDNVDHKTPKKNIEKRKLKRNCLFLIQIQLQMILIKE